MIYVVRSTMPFFDILHNEKHTRARAGVIHTDHGDIETPMFMPVGTQATVKSLDSRDLHELGAQIILGNTYHLRLRPGEDLIASFGGLHKFMNWGGPILTDSGGFQIFSLGLKNERTRLTGGRAKKRKDITETNMVDNQGGLVEIDEDGVTFRSHIDGSTHRFTPEIATDIQRKLGADIIMAFDECTGDNVSEQYARAAMERTHRWAERCVSELKNSPRRRAGGRTNEPGNYRQFLFGIIQGAKYEHLRRESARIISGMDFDGIAIGGESVGYNMEATKEILEWARPIIPENKPHYAMGVGFSPLDLFEVVERGIDMFDCVAPTRLARTGMLFVKDAGKKFRLNISNAQYQNDKNPIDASCLCATCAECSRAYLHHLFDANELLAYRLATIHNLYFFLNLMREMRAAILEDKFLKLKRAWTVQ